MYRYFEFLFLEDNTSLRFTFPFTDGGETSYVGLLGIGCTIRSIQSDSRITVPSIVLPSAFESMSDSDIRYWIFGSSVPGKELFKQLGIELTSLYVYVRPKHILSLSAQTSNFLKVLL